MGDSAPKKSSGILRKLFDILLLGGLVGISIYLIVDAQNRKDENVNPVQPNYSGNKTWCSKGREKVVHKEYERTFLDDYVWKIDGAYNYEIVTNEYSAIDKLQTIVVNYTSQRWLEDVDWHGVDTGTKIWWHWMVIYVPLEGHKNYNPDLLDTGAVLIDGGDNSNSPNPPDPSNPNIFMRITKMLAQQTGSVSCILFNIPYQRVSFAEDWKESRREDDLIAYTWARFLNETREGRGNPEMLLLAPMTKAAVLSFNATSDIVSKETVCGPRTNRVKCRPGPLDRWMPTGGSKRGWTTWLAGAVDFHRVKAMAPVVLSFLNMIDNFHHYWRAYGGWSFAMEPYYNEGITKLLDDPLQLEVRKVLDPYMFKERLRMPKLVISTAGDEFFMPDDTHYWLSDMEGPTFYRLLPNAEHATALHSLTTNNYVFTMRHFFMQTMLDLGHPEYCSTRYTNENGVHGVKFMTNERLRGIEAYVTDTRNGKKRDYRLVGLTDPDSEEILEIAKITIENTTHFQANPYMDEFSNSVRQRAQIQANLWRPFEPKRNYESEWEYEYFIELDKAHKGYRAMLLNAQFMGSWDDLGWFEVTSEVQFTQDDIDPFEDCYAESCYGHLV